MKQYLLPEEGQFYKANMHVHTTYSDGILTPEEVKDIERRNRDYRRHRPVEELFFRHYRLPREGEAPTLLSAAHIYEHLTRCDARLMKSVCAQTFGKVLRGLGAVRSEHHDRRVYAVIPVEF